MFNAQDIPAGDSSTFFTKFGYSDSIGTGAAFPLWDGDAAYSYLTSATKLKLSSSDSADTSLLIGVYGLDANYDEISEVKALDASDGQTAVETENLYLRGYRLRNLSADGNNNAGVIWAGTGTVTAGVPANKYAAISIGENQSLIAMYTVPNKKTLYVKNMLVSVGASTKSGIIRLRAREEGSVFQTKEKFVITQATVPVEFDPPLVFTQKTDIEITAISLSGTIEVSGSYGGNLLENVGV